MSAQQRHHERSAESARPYSHSGGHSGSHTDRCRSAADAREGFAGTLLIVDDEASSAEALSMVLRHQGYCVFTAANGRDGLRLIEEVSPELVILDFMMPVMNGAELGRRLRANRATRNIPIVMSSGTSELTIQKDFSDYDAFLRKPNDIARLLAVIRQLLVMPEQ